MSSTPAIVPTGAEASANLPAAQDANPLKNPSYPDRTHFGEKKTLEQTLKDWDQKIAGASKKLGLLGQKPNRAEYERIYHQMLGARDQLALAVKRMPLEAGGLYHEDHELLHIAEAALARLFKSWDAVK